MSAFGIPEDQPFTIRPGKMEDYPFILSSWSNEAHRIKFDNFIPNKVFYPRQKNLINKVLAQSLIFVAHLDDNEDEIAGYIVLQPAKSNILYIHWAHVKPLYRRIGIFKGLLSSFIQDSSPTLVATSPFSLLQEFKKKTFFVYDPGVIDPLRSL